MPIHLKRIVFFFCILNSVLGCCLGHHATAVAESKIYLPGILKEFGWTPERDISGKVSFNGIGLEGVGIYDNTVQVALTDSQGNYTIRATHFAYTLIPQQTCYQFSPPSIVIPADQYSRSNQNFTDQSQACITISGKVIWKNSSGDTTIPSNPLPMVAMEAYSQAGSLFSRVVTGADGNYSIAVPVNWS